MAPSGSPARARTRLSTIRPAMTFSHSIRCPRHKAFPLGWRWDTTARFGSAGTAPPTTMWRGLRHNPSCHYDANHNNSPPGRGFPDGRRVRDAHTNLTVITHGATWHGASVSAVAWIRVGKRRRCVRILIHPAAWRIARLPTIHAIHTVHPIRTIHACRRRAPWAGRFPRGVAFLRLTTGILPIGIGIAVGIRWARLARGDRGAGHRTGRAGRLALEQFRAHNNDFWRRVD